MVDALLPQLGMEDDPEVVQALVAALGHAGDPRSQDAVIACANSSNVDVRYAVAWALPSIGQGTASLEALRQLSRDVDDDVRDWATFGLAESDATDPETVEALFQRTSDSHYDTRCEAILGLATRHDPRAQALVDRELARPMVGGLIREAEAALTSG